MRWVPKRFILIVIIGSHKKINSFFFDGMNKLLFFIVTNFVKFSKEAKTYQFNIFGAPSAYHDDEMVWNFKDLYNHFKLTIKCLRSSKIMIDRFGRITQNICKAVTK